MRRAGSTCLQGVFAPFGTLARGLLATSLLFHLLVAIVSGATAPENYTALVFGDEFEGAAPLSASWDLEFVTGTGCPGACGWGGEEKQSYQAENAMVQDGELRIWANRSATALGPQGIVFTSAYIASKRKFLYGMVETRVKMPAGVGLMPSVMLKPSDAGVARYGDGDSLSGEVDIVTASDACTEAGHLIKFANDSSDSHEGGPCVTPISIGLYYVYKIIWEKDSFRWYVNDVLVCEKRYWTTLPSSQNSSSQKDSSQKDSSQEAEFPYPAPFDLPFRVAIKLALGPSGPTAPSQTVDNGVLPQALAIDYVRIYELPGPGGPSPTPALPTPAPTPTSTCPQTLKVSGSDDVTKLQKILDAPECAYSALEVTWVGRVVVGSAITLPYRGNFSLTVRGFDSAAEVAGNGTDRLFAYWGSHLYNSPLEKRAALVPDPLALVDTLGSDALLRLVGLTLTGGQDSFSVLYPQDSQLYRVVDSARGGCIANDRGRLIAENVVFRGCLAGWAGGGAVFHRGPWDPEEVEEKILAGDVPVRAAFSNCSFSDCAAAGHGGALFLEDSSATFQNCVFANNYARGGQGGAIYQSGGTSNFSQVTLANNSAVDGGAVFIQGVALETPTRLSVSATRAAASFSDCELVGNSARDRAVDGGGGALRMDKNASVVISNSSIHGNTAASAGGAVFASYFSVLDITGSDLTQNIAQTGGGVALSGNSNLTALQSVLTLNSAKESGGGLYAGGESAVALQNCFLARNRAGTLGSGVLLSGRSALVAADSAFASNALKVAGAAVQIDGYSSMKSWKTNFTTTSIDAEELALVLSTGSTAEIYKATFSGWVGDRAIFYAGSLLRLDACDFSGSSTAPDIVSSTSPTESQGTSPAVIRNAVIGSGSWENAVLAADHSFGSANIATCAQLGAGSSCTGCIDGPLGVLCECYESAVNSSGATEQVCLHGPVSLRIADQLPDTKPTAGKPGAIPAIAINLTADAAAQTAVLWRASAREIPAAGEEDGGSGAASWTATPSAGILFPGATTTVQLTSSKIGLGDGVHEVAATFLASTFNSSAEFLATFSLDYAHCDAAYFYDSTVVGGQCVACRGVDGVNQDGVNCDDAGNSLSSLELLPGFWRATNASLRIDQCFNKDACPGVKADGGDGYCAPGYQGPLCAQCADDFAPGPGDTCEQCSNGTSGAMYAALALAALLVIVTVVLVGWFLIGPKAGGSDADYRSLQCTRWRRAGEYLSRLPWAKLRIPVVAMQIVTLFSSITGAALPEVYQTFLRYMSFVNLDVTLLLGCVAPNFSFYDRLLVMTLGPLLLLALLGLTFRLAIARARGVSAAEQALAGGHFSAAATQAKRAAETRHMLTILVVAFLLFASCSTAVFQTFACVETEIGSYLRADMNIKCEGSTYKLFKVYAVFMVFVYPIGIPLLFVRQLTHYRRRYLQANSRNRVYPEPSQDYWKPGKEIDISAADEMVFVSSAKRASAEGTLAEEPVGAQAVPAPTESADWLRPVPLSAPAAEQRLPMPLPAAGADEVLAPVPSQAPFADQMLPPESLRAPAADQMLPPALSPTAASAEPTETLAANQMLPAPSPEAASAEPTKAAAADQALPPLPPPPYPTSPKPTSPAAKPSDNFPRFRAVVEQLHWRKTKPEAPQAVRFLARSYRPKRFWFEPIECLRRLMLTGVLVFIVPDTPAQAAAACLLCIFFTSVFAVLEPMRDLNDTMAWVLGAFIILLTMFQSLAIKAGAASSDSDSQKNLSVVLIILSVFLLAAAVLQIFVMAGNMFEADEVRDFKEALGFGDEALPGPGSEAVSEAPAIEATKGSVGIAGPKAAAAYGGGSETTTAPESDRKSNRVQHHGEADSEFKSEWGHDYDGWSSDGSDVAK